MKRMVILPFLLILFLVDSSGLSAQGRTKVLFPYTPIGAASLPWWIAKESRYFEKYGLDVDMVYVGASPVIVQAMLGGQAGLGAGGGPPLVTNVLQGGDIVQVATTIPYAIQSLIVKSEIKTVGDLVGKRVGISRLGAIPHFTLQAIFNLYNVHGVNVVQTGTTTQAITSLSQGLVDGIITSAPFTFRLMKDGYRELVSPRDFKKAGIEFLINGIVARKSFGVKNREIVIRFIKGTMEGVKEMFVNQRQTKTVLAKYTRQTAGFRSDVSLRARGLCQRSHRLTRFDPAHRAAVGSMEPGGRQTSEQHASECLLRQQLCRGDQAIRLSVGALEMSRNEARRMIMEPGVLA